MVGDTRSAHKSKDGERKRKDEEEGSSSKKKVNTRQCLSVPCPRKADVAGIKSLFQETSVSRHTMPSPQSTWKSMHLEKGTPSLTPPEKRKSERLVKSSTPSPSWRSDSGMKKLSPGVSAVQKSTKELKLPEPKKQKKKTLIQVTMESEKAEPELEGVGMKRKKMTGRSFKALYKQQLFRKEIVAVATPSGSHTCENHNLMGTCVQCSKNKRVGYDSSKQELCSCSPMVDKCLDSFSTYEVPSPRKWKRINYLDASPRKPETETDDVAEKRKRVVNENLNPALVQVELEAHQVTQVASSKQVKACDHSKFFQEDSITAKSNPNGLSGLSSVGAEVSIDACDEGIVSVDEQKKKKRDKQVRKLTRKHKEKIQEFHRAWEEKRLKLETDHKLESAFIRSIHGQGPQGTEKLKLLEENFAKKIEEHNLLKDAQLKDLEEKHLDAMSMVVHLNQSKPSSNHANMVSGNLPDPVSQGSDENQLVDLTEAFTIEVLKTVRTKAGGHVEPLELIDASKKKSDKVSIITSPDALVHHSDADEEASGDLPTACQTVATADGGDLLQPRVHKDISGQSSVSPQLHELDASPVELKSTSSIEIRTSELSELPDNVEASATGVVVTPVPVLSDEAPVTENPGLLQPQVRQDKSGQSSESPQLHGSGASPVELRSTSRIELRTSELIDTVSELPDNIEAPATGEVVTPVPVTEDPGELHSVPVSVDVSCNPLAAIEDHDQSRISSQTAEPGGREVLPHVSVSLGAESLEIHSDHPDVGASARVDHGQSEESSRISENDMATPQVLTTAERPNPAVPQQGIDAGYLCGGSYAIQPMHLPRFWNSTALLPIDPFRNELERMRKEAEQMEKSHQDLTSQLKSECEREMHEIFAQIRKKYELKFQEAESEFKLKRNDLDKKQNKVLMNKKLAEAFMSMCEESRPPSLPGSMLQGLFHPLLQSPSMRPSASHPGPTYPSSQRGPTRPVHITTQEQQPSRSHPVRPTQSITAQHIQTVQQSVALMSGNFSRPPVISAVTPAGNPRLGGEVRQPAPHLQFRPVQPSPSIPTATSTSAVQFRPSPVPPSHPPPAEPSPPPPPLTNMVSNPGLVMDTNNRTPVPLPDITFHAQELSDLELLGNVQSNPAFDGVVCLSDDE